MKNRIIIGIIVMLAGFLYMLIPQFILPVCEYVSGNGPPMKCFWSARTELGLGAAVIFGGLLLLLLGNTAARLGISLMLLAVAILGAAIPTVIIGVCRSDYMPCRAGTLPALMILSGLLVIFLLFNILYLAKANKRGSGSK